jgi:hypothetical protein
VPDFAEFSKRRRRELAFTQMQVALRIIQDVDKPLSLQITYRHRERTAASTAGLRAQTAR